MRLLALVVAATFVPRFAAAAPRPALCARLQAALDAASATRSGERKWIVSWNVVSDPRDLRAALAGKVVRTLDQRANEMLVIATAAQLARLPPDIVVLRDADELDRVTCGSLGYSVPARGGVAPRLALVPPWRSVPPAGPARYCVQVVQPELDEQAERALAIIMEASARVPLYCGRDAPATCELAMTSRQAAAVARLPFVRGVFRREPALKLGSSLACPGEGDAPLAPADVPAVLRAAIARPDERVEVDVQLDEEPEVRGRFEGHLPAGTKILRADQTGATLSLPRRALPALAGLAEVEKVSEIASASVTGDVL